MKFCLPGQPPRRGNMGPEFFQTIMGKDFYDRVMPNLVKQIARVADALEAEQTESVSLRVLLLKMEQTPLKSKSSVEVLETLGFMRVIDILAAGEDVLRMRMASHGYEKEKEDRIVAEVEDGLCGMGLSLDKKYKVIEDAPRKFENNK